MKKVQKGFTLVELIVVITILAVLGTIAFVSLQGYSQDAKNSKVTSDVRTLTTAIETAMTNGTVTQVDALPTNTSSYGSSSLLTTYLVGSGTALSAANYKVGEVNFQTLRQNGDDFTYDAAGTTKKYLIGAMRMTGNSTFKQGLQMYQVAGAVSTNGTYKPVVKGNFVKYSPDTANGLIKDTDGVATGLVNDSGATMNGTTLY